MTNGKPTSARLPYADPGIRVQCTTGRVIQQGASTRARMRVHVRAEVECRGRARVKLVVDVRVVASYETVVSQRDGKRNSRATLV